MLVGLVTVSLPAAADPFRCSWQDVELAPGRTADATGASLALDGVELELLHGDLWQLEACGHVVGVLGRGAGRVRLLDPGAERAHGLFNEYSNLPGEVDLEAFVLIASDGSVQEMLASTAGAWRDQPLPPAAFDLQRQRLAGFDPSRQSGVAVHPPGEVLWAPLPELGGAWLDLKLAGVQRRRTRGNLEFVSPWLTFTQTSGAGHQPPEGRRWQRRAVGSTLGLELASYPPAELRSGTLSPFVLAEPEPATDLLEASISVVLKPVPGIDQDVRSIEVVTDLRVHARRDTAWATLSLAEGRRMTYGDRFQPLEVQGISGADGPLLWHRSGDRLFVRVDAQRDEVFTLAVRTRGDITEPEGLTALRPLRGFDWYPRPPQRDRHDFELRVAAPKRWKVAATGRRLELLESGNLRHSVFRSSRPVLGGGLVAVDSRVEELAGADGLPVLRIHRTPDTVALHARIGKQVQAHLRSLSDVLGPFPFAELEIVERRVPGGWSSTPGLIVLPRFDSPPNQVITSRLDAQTTLLQALARQWLQADRGAFSEHDLWLEESLAVWAECFALNEAEQPARCNALLSDKRMKWFDALAARSAGAAGDGGGPQAYLVGPIWQGPNSGWAWQNNVLRAPLVLQQLRILMGEQAARTLLRRVVQRDSLRTMEFIADAQAVAGRDLRTFFYGWVLATPQDPRGELSWNAGPQGEGWSLQVTGRLDAGRDAAPVPLQAPVVLLVDTADGPELRVVVLGPEAASVQLPMAAEPRSVRADPTRTFLGRLEVTHAP